MGYMPNSLSGTKNLKNAIALKKNVFFYRECRFYIIYSSLNMQVMFWDIWIMQNVHACQFLEYFLDFNCFFAYYLGFFAKKHIFSSRILFLLIQLFIIILLCNLCLVTEYPEYPCFTVYWIFLDFSHILCMKIIFDFFAKNTVFFASKIIMRYMMMWHKEFF